MSFYFEGSMSRSSDARLAHIGIAVADLDEALAFYRTVLGVEPGPAEEVDGARIVPLTLGNTHVELLSSRETGTPIARFLERHGPGIHHVCYQVADLEAALEKCRAAGYRLVDETPRRGAGGRRIAFLHPRSTSGILIELTE
jgi:methylmalonyl-CoA/ethylmalonyl-CoA epimerase